MSEPSMIPIPAQASMPWIIRVSYIPRLSLAKAGKAASMTWPIAHIIARPMIDSKITSRDLTAFRFSDR